MAKRQRLPFPHHGDIFGKQRYSFIHSYPLHDTEVIRRHYTAAALPQEKTPALTEQEAGWPPEPVQMFWRRGKSLVPNSSL